MSESSFPFQGGTAIADPPAHAAPLADAAETDSRSKLLLLGGLAAVVVLAVVGYFLFFAGGGSEAPAPVTKPRAVVPAAPAEQPAAVPPTSKKINSKSFGRDPFKALIVEAPAAAAAPQVGSTTTASGTTTTGSTTTQSGTTTDSGVTAPTPTQSHSFRVVSVAPDNSAITVNVDGKRYNNLKAGEVFAKYFKVVLISGTTNAFQYGEEKFNVLGTKRLTIA